MVNSLKGVSAEEHKRLLRSVGTHRTDRPLSPVEVAGLFQKAISAGSTRNDCAGSAGLGQSQVATFLKLLNLAPEIQHLADWGGATTASVSFSSLAELARLRPSDQTQAANAILQHRLAWKEVVQLVQLTGRSNKSIEECIDTVLKLRPQIERRHLFVGAITSEKLAHHLSGLSQRERDELLSGALRNLLHHPETVSSRLGIDRFTITSSQSFADMLGLKADEAERALNEAMEQTRGDQ